MAVSEAQKKAARKYQTEKTDSLRLRLPKGKKDLYKAEADRQGKSLTKLIMELLDKELQK